MTVRLLDVREAPLSVDEVLAAVADPSAGGTALFLGTVRDHDEGRPVTGLAYSAHPGVRAALETVARRVDEQHETIALAAVHRVGPLVVGDLAVVVAVSAAHRGQAFDAARQLIDDLKHEVPIWKHQGFADGAPEWVGV